MNRPTAPCKTCEKRQVGCHTYCKDFKTYEETRKEWVALVNRNKDKSKEVKIGKWYR